MVKFIPRIKKPVTTTATSRLPTRAKASIIDQYALGTTVAKLRKQGYSYLAIAKEINNTNEQLKQTGEIITSSSVMQYVHLHGIDDVLDEHKTMEIVNVYNENKRLLNILERQMEMVQIFLDDIQRECYTTGDVSELYTRMRELSVDLEKYIARKQSILTNMQAIQDKVYNTESLSIIIKEMLDILKKKDQKLYEEVISEVKNNQIILATYQKMKSDSELL